MTAQIEDRRRRKCEVLGAWVFVVVAAHACSPVSQDAPPDAGAADSSFGVPCSDHDPCNGEDYFDREGVCAHGFPGTSPLDDDNPCTVDTCDIAGGIAHSPTADGTTCFVRSMCRTGRCEAGECRAGGPSILDDGDACTLDNCTGEGLAAHLPLSAEECANPLAAGCEVLPDLTLPQLWLSTSTCISALVQAKKTADPGGEQFSQASGAYAECIRTIPCRTGARDESTDALRPPN